MTRLAWTFLTTFVSVLVLMLAIAFGLHALLDCKPPATAFCLGTNDGAHFYSCTSPNAGLWYDRSTGNYGLIGTHEYYTVSGADKARFETWLSHRGKPFEAVGPGHGMFEMPVGYGYSLWPKAQREAQAAGDGVWHTGPRRAGR